MKVQYKTREQRKGTVYSSVLNLIGNTPLIKISKLTREVKNVAIYAKAEWYNPGGSVKDRAAKKNDRRGREKRAVNQR